jgi:hypothetical protein
LCLNSVLYALYTSELKEVIKANVGSKNLQAIWQYTLDRKATHVRCEGWMGKA